MSVHYLGKYEPRKLSFQSCCCCIPCLENDTTSEVGLPGTCSRLCLLLGRENIHCSGANQLAKRSRLRAEQCEEARHRSYNACCVVGQRSPRRWCPLLSQNLAALSCSSSSRGESERQILRWWVPKKCQPNVKAVSFSTQGITKSTQFSRSMFPQVVQRH